MNDVNLCMDTHTHTSPQLTFSIHCLCFYCYSILSDQKNNSYRKHSRRNHSICMSMNVLPFFILPCIIIFYYYSSSIYECALRAMRLSIHTYLFRLRLTLSVCHFNMNLVVVFLYVCIQSHTHTHKNTYSISLKLNLCYILLRLLCTLSTQKKYIVNNWLPNGFFCLFSTSHFIHTLSSIRFSYNTLNRITIKNHMNEIFGNKNELSGIESFSINFYEFCKTVGKNFFF